MRQAVSADLRVTAPHGRCATQPKIEAAVDGQQINRVEWKEKTGQLTQSHFHLYPQVLPETTFERMGKQIYAGRACAPVNDIHKHTLMRLTCRNV